LLIRKSIRKLSSNKGGFSSIVGAIFAVLVIISITSGIFVWSINQNTNYNNAVRQSTQADIDRLNEQALANITAYRINNNVVGVKGSLQNAGPLAVTVETLWVVDTTSNQFNFSSVNLTLNAGSQRTVSGSMLNVSLANSLNDNLICWFITSRGNTISQYSLVLANAGNANVTNVYQYGNTTNNRGGDYATYANVSQGIGLIGFDFKGFTIVDSATDFANHSQITFRTDYSLRTRHYIVFHAILTNFDPAHSNYVINASSCVYMLFSQLGAVKFGIFPLVSVTNEEGSFFINKAITNPTYTLVYEQPKDVYFYGQVDNNISPLGVYPLNIMVFGKLGSNDYGQNVPFVSMNVVS